MAFRLFNILDQSLVQMESKTSPATRTTSVWPSEASAVLLDQRKSNYVGKCHRASFFRMIGEPPSDKIGPVAARRFRMGKMCEEDVTIQAKHAGVFAASGIKHYIKDLDMSIEIDLLVVDPETGQGFIVENKSVYGWYSGSEIIKGGNPKLEAVMQATLYLNELPTGAAIKEAIRECLAKQVVLNASGKLHRNRIEVNEEVLEKMSDGPMQAKVTYEMRDDCTTREFDLWIEEDPIDGLHFPVIDGEVKEWYTVESIYERFEILKSYHRAAQAEAKRRLELNGLVLAPDASEQDKDYYYEKLGEELRALPIEWFPPAEFEWRYSDEKIVRLATQENPPLISKTKYAKWQKQSRGGEFIGDFNCSYCDWKLKCVVHEYPEYRHLALSVMDDEAA